LVPLEASIGKLKARQYTCNKNKHVNSKFVSKLSAMKILIKIWFISALYFFPFYLYSQITINITSLPGNTPSTADIYIAGSFNNWNPGDVNYKLQKIGSSYTITLKEGNGNAEFKFTRGTWGKVECSIQGGQIPNRKFTYASNLVLNLSIAGWEDLLVAAGDTGSTALPNVKLLSNNFYMPQLKRSRRVWVYLPNDYDFALTKRYSVLYMHDGQNLFDNKTSFAGEWGIDETLSKLEKAGDQGCIVVGIDNGGSNRMNEYNPYVHKQYGGGEGEAYVQFIVETLKPYIDSAYRTHSDQRHTGIAGSSMGGLISIYGALAYPNVFGKVGVFSPALWLSDSLFEFAKNRPIEPGIMVYYIAGRNESTKMVSDITTMDSILNNKGVLSYNSSVNIKSDGEHKEWFWKREFGPFYQQAFFDVSNGNQKQWQDRLEKNTKLIPNPASEYTEIKTWPIKTIKVLMNNGTQLFEAKVDSPTYKLDVSNYPNGLYYVLIDFGFAKVTKTLEVNHK
jgi:predicted alpha/beta superfamily hydrolase